MEERWERVGVTDNIRPRKETLKRIQKRRKERENKRGTTDKSQPVYTIFMQMFALARTPLPMQA